MYVLKSFKTFKGHEGERCAQGSLHGPTGKAAEWSDDSWGGEMRVHFVSVAAEAAFVTWARGFLATRRDYDGEPFAISEMSSGALGIRAIEQMSFDYETLAAELREVKKGIAYYRAAPKEPGGKALFLWKAPYTAENLAVLKAKHADLVEVINERLQLKFVDGEAFLLSERNKRWKRECRTKTLLLLRADDGSSKEMVATAPYTADLAKRLRAKYPSIIEIINERFL